MIDPPDQPAQRGNRRWPRKLFVVFLILAVLYAGYRYTLHRMVEAKLNEIRKQGYRVTLAELDKWYPQPAPGENAADVYRQAFKSYDNWATNRVEVWAPSWATNEVEKGELAPNLQSPDAQTSWIWRAPPRMIRRVETEFVPTNSVESLPSATNPVPQLFRVMAFKRHLLPIVGIQRLPPRTKVLPDKMRTCITEYINDNTEALKLLHRAVTIPESRYPIDFEHPFDFESGRFVDLSHLNRVADGARLLCLDAVLWEEKGRFDQAADCLIESLTVGQSLSREPLLISQLRRFECQDQSIVAFEYLLNRTSFAQNRLAALQTTLMEAEDSKAMTTALVGEQCCGIYYIEQFSTTVSLGFRKWTGIEELELLSYLDRSNLRLEIARSPLTDRFAAANALTNEEVTLGEPPWLLYSGDQIVRDIKRITNLRAALTAVAVERYRSAQGVLPDKLVDLAPVQLEAVPLDPFDGHPLRYKRLLKGYAVYSVGEGGKDDGGDEKKDITFTVER